MGNSLRSLQLKIIVGYVSLVMLFLIVLYLNYREKDGMAAVDKQTERLLAQRRQTETIAVEILDLSLLGEQLITWKDEEIARYRAKKDTVALHLQQLKFQSPSTEQQERIDAVLALLDVKEKCTCFPCWKAGTHSKAYRMPLSGNVCPALSSKPVVSRNSYRLPMKKSVKRAADCEACSEAGRKPGTGVRNITSIINCLYASLPQVCRRDYAGDCYCDYPTLDVFFILSLVAPPM